MKVSYNSPVILSFALLCTTVFFLDKFLLGGLMSSFTLTSVSMNQPTSLFTLVSHVVGHANLDHLLGNMTFILLLGPMVEEKYGSSKTILMILVTALVTGLLNFAFLNTGLLGASGIVFMLILIVSFTNSDNNTIPLTFILVALLFIGKEVLQSLQADQVSQFAHIIGGVVGSIFGFMLKKKPALAV